MVDYLKKHEAYIREKLAANDMQLDWKKLNKLHERKIKYLQHERLIHLLVTLSVALFALLTIFFTVLTSQWLFAIVAFLFIILLIPYLLHYRTLENGIQRLYSLSEEINKKL